MTKWILKTFVKDYENVSEPKVRENCGKLGSIVGICANILLFAGKFTAGLLFNSIATTADAVNNLSDAGSSVISLFSFRLSNKPADEKHPFGHARIEYIASMIVSFLILFLGFELGKSSIEKIIHPEEAVFSLFTTCVLAVSIVVKLGMYLLYKGIGRHIDSSMMRAAATDSLSDVLATSGVLLSAILSPLTGFQLDGYMGLLVAVFIFVAGINILRDMLDKLLGQAPDSELTDMIEQKILGYQGVLGIHDLMVHNYGPGRCFASVHVEVSSKEDILKSHDLIDNIERDFTCSCGIQLVIHLDPIVVDDEQINALRDLTKGILQDIDPALSMHDFRAVVGDTHTNLLFDITIPHDYAMSDEALLEEIERRLDRQKGHTYFAVVTFDRLYVSASSPRESSPADKRKSRK